MAGEDVQREQLTALRQRLRIPQQEVAAACEVDRSMYSRWESGYCKLTDLQVNKIACYLVEQWRRQTAEGERLVRAVRLEQYAQSQGVHA